MRRLFLLGLAMLTFPGRAYANGEPLFASEPLNDEELAEARGGFSLPGGIEVAFGAMITTSVGGDTLLQTTMQLTEQGWSATGQWANGVPVQVAGANTSAGANGIVITPAGSSAPSVTLTVEQADLFVQHAFGDRISSTVINTADNRIIDSQVSLYLQLDNVSPLAVGSAGFQVEALGIDAASFRVP